MKTVKKDEFLPKTMGYDEDLNRIRKQEVKTESAMVLLQNFASELFDLECWEYLSEFGEYRYLIYGMNDYGTGNSFSITALMNTIGYNNNENCRKMNVEIVIKINSEDGSRVLERFKIGGNALSLDEALLTVSKYTSNFDKDADKNRSALKMIYYCKEYIKFHSIPKLIKSEG